MATKNITGNAGTLSLLGNNTVNVSGLTEANIGSPTIGSTTTINLEPGSELVGSIRDAAGTLNLGTGLDVDNTATKAASSTIDSGTIGVLGVAGTGDRRRWGRCRLGCSDAYPRRSPWALGQTIAGR